MEAAKTKIKEFGRETGATVGEHKAAAAAMKTLEGHFLNNTRAADSFLVSVLKLGPVLQAAFPVIGAIAFVGILIDVGSKVYEFFAKLKEGPEKAALAFHDLTASFRTTNDELQVSNDKLENEIAKLEHRPSNNLKTSLDEARVAADKLGESIAKDMDKINKLLEEQEGKHHWYSFGLGSTPEVGDILERNKKLTEDIRRITDEGAIAQSRATDDKSRDAAQTRTNTELARRYASELNLLNSQIKAEQAAYEKGPLLGGTPVAGAAGVAIQARAAARLAELKEITSAVQAQQQRVGLTSIEQQDEALKKSADAAHDAEEAAKKAAEAIKKFNEEYFKARAEAVKQIGGAPLGTTTTGPVAGFGQEQHATIDNGADKAIAASSMVWLKQQENALKGLQEIDKMQDQFDLSRMDKHQQALYQIDIHEREETDKLYVEWVKGGITWQQYQDGTVLAEQTAINKKKELEDQFSTQREQALARLAQLEDLAATGRYNKNAFALAKILGDEQKQMAEYQKLHEQQLISDQEFADAQVAIAQVASQKRQQVLDAEASKMQSWFDRTIKSAKSGADIFKNLLNDIESYAEKMIFRELAAITTAGSSGQGRGGGIGGFFTSLLSSIFGGGGFASGVAGKTVTPFIAGPLSDFGFNFGFPGLATGGDIYGPAIVGESGPELFIPSGSGSILPNSRMGGQNNYFSIDARGAAPGSEIAIARGIRQAMGQAVQVSVATMKEMQARTP